jgi:NADH-quinone oxidoreductase subunit C
MQVPDVSAGEKLNQIDASVQVQLDERHTALRDRLSGAFGDLEFEGFRAELTAIAKPELLLDVLRFVKSDPDVACELLADISAVHWPGGVRGRQTQETTGWPTYDVEQDGRIDVHYLLRSIQHGHWFRLRVSVGEEAPELPSATAVYAGANMWEREVYDLMGVRFAGHPRLERIFMPDDWEGHPLRKDYPLGGVEVQYKGATVPSPDSRQY